jgi:hypothetical protein
LADCPDETTSDLPSPTRPDGAPPAWWSDTLFAGADDRAGEYALRTSTLMGRIIIRDDVHRRTVPARELHGEIEIDVTGAETCVTVPKGVNIERRDD